MSEATVRKILSLAKLLELLGALLLAGFLCSLPATGPDGIVWLAAFAWPLGAGILVSHHSSRYLKGAPSGPFRLPAIWVLIGVFALAIIILNRYASPHRTSASFLLAIVLPVAAVLPPLWSLSWFTNGGSGNTTWRRGLVAFAGGATLSVFLSVTLEVLLPNAILALVLDLADRVLGRLDLLLAALADQDIAAALSSRGFLYGLIQLAVIAPLVEELVKPLVTLPLLARLDRRDAFLVGAWAGAGFAAVENVIYAGLGPPMAAGILAVRALGGAIHPLGAGLMALGWRSVLQGESGAGRRWLMRFASSVGVHALWNGGSLLVIALAGAHFIGDRPTELDLLGVSAGATTFALIVILGLGALWIGRVLARGEERLATEPFDPGDRSLALWALACLVVLIPAGIAGLKIILW